MMQEDFMIFFKITKKIVDFYISCNVTIRNKYLFGYVSDISILKIKSLTITWNNYMWESNITATKKYIIDI